MIHWSQKKISAFQQTLLAWYDQQKRDLPWRRDHDPYHVWISEIMLQQTQVQTVIPYYNRFIKQFPNVQSLAEANEDDLMKAWEGLGYYSRARNLQKAANQLVQDYGGKWPTTVEDLQSLSGIGPYTAGAIASITFNQPVAAIDGNAYRVFARLLEIDEDIAKPQTRKLFEKVVNQIISKDRPGDFNQAIMDLGASYMTAANYDSANSPVKAFNQAYLDGVEANYPVKTKKKRPVPVDYFGLIICSAKGYLYEHRPTKGILGGFWMFPLIKRNDLIEEDDPKNGPSDALMMKRLVRMIQVEDGLDLKLKMVNVKPVSHTFTHQKWHITLLEGQLPATSDLSYFPGKWVQPANFDRLTFSKVQDKMWTAYQKRAGD